MRILTNTAEVKARCSAALTRIFNRVHSREAPDWVDTASAEFQRLMAFQEKSSADHSSETVQIDPQACVECSRCARACKELQGIAALEMSDSVMAPVVGAGRKPMVDTDCIGCGQCTAFCPTGAIHEKSDFSKIRAAMAAGKVIVCQTAPAPRVAIGEEFGMAAGTISTRKMVGALKAAGFHFVFDTNWGADLTIVEEGTELLHRIKTGGVLPMFTSCCPAWINLCEKLYPQLLPHLSTCKSPQGMQGALIKTWWAERMGKAPTDIFLVSVMPCVAKKDEILRHDLSRQERQDIDQIMTTREVARFMKEQGVQDWSKVPELSFDDPMGDSTGAAALFAATGGVMEAALRTAYEVHTGKRLDDAALNFTACRGFQGIKEATIDLDGTPVKIGVVHTSGNVRKFLEQMMASPDRLGFHFIEIMCCQGGCIGGGGQPKSDDPNILAKRMAAVYEIDATMVVRRSHENPSVLRLYKDFLGEFNGHKAHELLHCHYHDRSHGATAQAVAVAPAPAADGDSKRALVIYATQTGNTEGAARRLHNELMAVKFNSRCVAMDAVTPAELAREPLVLVLTSTFGEGERPDMAAPVWDWLSGQSVGALANTTFAVFGLGSSKYHKFCEAALQFDRRLEELGGRRLIECGKGDETADDGYATAFDPWLGTLWDELGVEPPKQAVVPHYRVVLSLEASSPLPPPPKTMFGTLLENKVITAPGYGRPIIYVEFDISQTGFEYNVGDSLGIHPSNPIDHVDSFLRWYRINPDAVISIVPVGENVPVLPLPPAITVRHLFERYLDIFSRPRKLFFRQLAQFAVGADKARLERLASNEGKDELQAYQRDFPSYVNVLRDFPTAHPTLDYLVEMVPPIKARLYSVASTPKEVPGRAQLVIAIPTEWSRQRREIGGGGLCTSFLAGFPIGTQIPVNVSIGTLRPPKESTAPMLMVGLGTGIAPMRALLRDRMMDKLKGLPVGPATLYQACRHRDKDFVLADEMKIYREAGVLTTHLGAFSHDNPARFETADLLMREHPEQVWEILRAPNAHYFYCGPAAYGIPGKLEAAITEACARAGGMTAAQAAEYIQKMKTEGRFVLEAF